MKKMSILMGIVFWLGTASSFAQVAFPTPSNPSTNPSGGPKIDPLTVCVVPKIDGDKVPFPLKSANTKFELAEDETYLLNGTIVNQNGKLYFQVDFDSQPWLATTKRVQFPYFLIDSADTTVMKKFDGSLVQMAVIVRKRDLKNDGEEWNKDLVLDIIAAPIPIQK